MAEEWGYQTEDSGLEFRKNGLSNEYNLNKVTDPGPEYITIYNPEGSLKSKLISVTMIVSVIVFCGLFFSYLYREKGNDQVSEASKASAHQ